MCHCPDGKLKKSCNDNEFHQELSRCAKTCLNGGRCINGECLCNEGWTGPHCGQPICGVKVSDFYEFHSSIKKNDLSKISRHLMAIYFKSYKSENKPMKCSAAEMEEDVSGQTAVSVSTASLANTANLIIELDPASLEWKTTNVLTN